MRLRANPAGVFLILFGLLFIGGGVLAGWIEWQILNDWHQTTAESTGSDVQDYRTRGNTRYHVSYSLRFSVEGREYIVPSNPNLTYGTRAAAEARARDFEAGTQHRIRYLPTNPYEVREKVSWTVAGIFGGIGVLLILIGAILPKRRVMPRQVASRQLKKAAGAVFLAAGIPLLIAGTVTGLQRSTILTKWPETTGTVTRSELDTPKRRYVTSVRYRPIIEVQYVVRGKELRAVAPMPLTANYAAAQAEAARYPLGAEIRIRFNPENPESIRLDGGWSLEFFLLPMTLCALGILFSPLGLLLLVR